MSKKKKKGNLLMKVIFSSSILTIAFFMVIIIACLMILDFFGANITDNYVENNMDYADMYKETVNKALKNGFGYVPLNRILYFYLENDKLSFYEIYYDNIDKDSNKMLPISDVCSLQKYKIYDVCKDLDSSDQIDVDQNKPFNPPIEFNKITVTSFFMEERVVFGKNDVHGGWDLACGNKTPVKARCKICGYEWEPIDSSLLRGANHKGSKTIHKSIDWLSSIVYLLDMLYNVSEQRKIC